MSHSARFLHAVRQALRAAGLPGGRILIGCSGGPDSTALLLALCALQAELELTLSAAYVDHGLRPASAAEGEAVLALCAELEVPAEAVRITVPPGPSLLSAARQARYAALCAAAERAGAGAVAVGHTASDQAETLLMRLLGGAGLRGLGGMAPARALAPGVQLIRPLLSLSRADVAAFLADAGVAARTIEDPTNQDRRHLRSRIRHQVLPLLRGERPEIDRHLSDLMTQLREDAACLDQLAGDALTRLVLRPTGEACVVSAAGLAALPRPLAVRVLERLLGPLSRQHVQALLALVQSRDGTSTLDLSGGRRAERRYDELWLYATKEPPPPPAPDTVAIPGPGRYRLGDVEIEIELLDAGAATPPDAAVAFDAEVVTFPFILRHPRPGDRMHVRGMRGRRKLSDIFIDEKLPRPLRRSLALLCRGDDILWAVGVRASASGAPTETTARLLLARWRNPRPPLGLTGRGRM
jgi:tRNA(Ile)-lysidine synthase